MLPLVEPLTDAGRAQASWRLSSWFLSLIWEPAGEGMWRHGSCGRSMAEKPKTWLQQNPWAAWISHMLRFALSVAKFSKCFGCSRHLILFLDETPGKLYVVVCQIKSSCLMDPLMQLIFKRELLVVVNLGHAWLNTVPYRYACISLNVFWL